MKQKDPRVSPRAETEARLLATASHFTVCWFRGIDRTHPELGAWEKRTYASLDEARAAKSQEGRDAYGRVGIIYAVAADTRTVHIE
jgi:hypothetical protein